MSPFNRFSRLGDAERRRIGQDAAMTGTETDGSPAPGTSRRVPALVYKIALLAIAWLFLVAAIAYGGGNYGPMVIGVGLVFACVFVAVPELLHAIEHGRRDRGQSPLLRSWLRDSFETSAGRLRGRDALIQILLVPLSIAVGFTLIALVELMAHA